MDRHKALEKLTMPLSVVQEKLMASGLPAAVEAAMLLEELFPEESTPRLKLDINTNRARRGDQEVALSPNEAILLHVMYTIGRCVTATELSAAVHGKHMKASPNSIRQAIPLLRRKVRKLGVRVINEFGRGYRITTSVGAHVTKKDPV